ncbi:glycoside hydrolase family 43 protein [Tuanshanicoccus lijuaniae]|uniref:glycoside hydrolase family 43 protein n=1 Tax=Aerococcaceae bacterium zg-1292 TaxID=2774330 RepID=UPI0019386634|nr:glycoside hydrolase family 43 protein [Aerococcaceae bacterium zg-1292]
MVKVQNPIIPGFYPDPSICRVGDDYYLACSSFELFPGVPIFHSRDLANWEKIGHALTGNNNFYVRANSYTGGVMAPTIRYHEGYFYIIVMNYSINQNILLKSENPSGPWSKPYLLTDVPGIDASLFFDDDNQAYIVGTIENDGKRYIYLNRFNIDTMTCSDERHLIWDSALRSAKAPEAPHLYKKDDYYYLIIAEGGTEFYHAVSVARSKTIDGWYEGYEGNPILTHRHLGKKASITNVGHADFVSASDGNWYAVMLGSRTIEGYNKNMGRESFLCPVIWEDGWPLLSPMTGKLEWEYEIGLREEKLERSLSNDFDVDFSTFDWNNLVFWGTPYQEFWELNENALKLKCLPRSLGRPIRSLIDDELNAQYFDNIAVIGCRQCHINYSLLCKMDFSPQESESAGLVILQGNNHHYRLEKIREGNYFYLQIVLCVTDVAVPIYMPGFSSQTIETVLIKHPIHNEEIYLKIYQKGQNISFYEGKSCEQMKCILENADGRDILPKSIDGMTGVILGMFATANGMKSDNQAVFKVFSYKGE